MSKCSSDIAISNDVRLVTGVLKKADPVDSVTYDGNNRPTQIVYNTSNGTETVTISYTNGFPVIDGIEYRGHAVDVWSAKLVPGDSGVKDDELIFDQNTSTILYLGTATFGALTSEARWKIKKIDTSTGVRITLASDDFDQIWDNRVSLTYV